MADVSFWGILGDNWYDQTGRVTASEYAKLSTPTLSKLTLMVPGNHDYWVLGQESFSTRLDQFGNGFMQWYAMDTRAARSVLPGNGSAPFDFSVDPSKGHPIVGGEKPQIDNHFFYNQIGNVGFVGYSGAYSLTELAPLMAEACAWLPTQPGVQLAVLLGHWDKPGLGASSDTDTPGLYDHVKALPGCKALDDKGMLKFIMGHTHCNLAHPHGHVKDGHTTGFMVAGFGMEGCGNYGLPMLDTTGGRVKMVYFPIVAEDGTDTYDEVTSCVSNKGWRQCTHLAETWLDQQLD